MTNYNYRDGRVWIQLNKFEPYKLLLPYGMSDLSDPVGSLNPIREPSPSKRGEQVTVDIVRGEPGLHSFNLDTRLRTTLNYMLGLRTKKVSIQAHLGQCDRPDNYLASKAGLNFPGSVRGDLGIDRVAIIQGDDQPINITVPWSAEGLEFYDFESEFLSARTISESEHLNFAAFVKEDCEEGYDPGDYGYVGGVFSLYGAVVWRTTDKGNTFTDVGSYPFGATESISKGAVLGTPFHHRLIVARLTTDGSNPAEIAYADVDENQTISWVNVNVDTTNGSYILALEALDWANMYVGLDNGEIWKSQNGGASWSIAKAAGSAINSISALRDGTVLAVGASDTIYLSEDFGETWDALTVPAADDYSACALAPDGTIFVGNESGGMYGSANNGVTWTTLSAQGITAAIVKDIVAESNDNIWAVVNLGDGTGRVVRSTDGGAGFYLWKLNMPTNTGLNDVEVIDPNFVWVVGDDGFVTLTNTRFIGL